MSARLKGVLLALAVCGLGLALVAWAGQAATEDTSLEVTASEAATVATEADAGDESFTVSYSGMIVSIDPKSGMLRQPTRAESRRLARTMEKALLGLQPKGAVEQRLEGGGVAMQLDPSHFDFTVARIGADGNKESGCISGLEQAEAALASSPRPSGPEEE